jgi:hypothetical protein
MPANNLFLNRHTNRKALLAAFICAAVVANGAWKAYQIITAKAAEQQQSLTALNRWKAEYELLAPYQKQWTEMIAPHTSITDLYSVNHALRLDKYGLATDPMKLIVDRIAPMEQSGMSLGATRLCLKTAGETGVALTAPQFSPDLLRGLSVFAERRDIETGNITLTTANNAPKVIMGLCLILRA